MEQKKIVEVFVCPICNMHKVVDKNIKGKIKFIFDVEKDGIIAIKDGSGGYKKGFPVIKRLTINQIKKDDSYKNLLQELKTQVEKLYYVLKGDKNV